MVETTKQNLNIIIIIKNITSNYTKMKASLFVYGILFGATQLLTPFAFFIQSIRPMQTQRQLGASNAAAEEEDPLQQLMERISVIEQDYKKIRDENKIQTALILIQRARMLNIEKENEEEKVKVRELQERFERIDEGFTIREVRK